MLINKKNWPAGPWHDEPDILGWTDPESELFCLILRCPGGHLCGYVGVQEGHPAFNKHYDDLPDFEVHGGLTFAGTKILIFENMWWIGFDCAHAGDYIPGTIDNPARALLGELANKLLEDPSNSDVYRNERYVRNEILKLAKELKEMAAAPKGRTEMA